MNLNLAALFASTHLFAFSAPVALDKADVAKIVRSAAEGLGCEIVSVEFEPRNDEITSYVQKGRVRTEQT